MTETRSFGRLFAASLLAVVALTAVWMRASEKVDDTQAISFSAYPVNTLSDRFRTDLEPFQLSGAWVIESPNTEAHSYSGLAIAPDGRLLAVTDRGRWALFPKPGERGDVEITPVTMRFPWGAFRIGDSEAVQVDAATGRRWVAFEHHNSIMRMDPETGANEHVRPWAMRNWPANKGAEVLIRLSDGRFVVVAETLVGEPLRQPALVFAGDPVDGAEVSAIRLAMPSGYRATDGAQLPDGRVLLLGRALRPPFGFSAILAIADPEVIRAGRPWTARQVARIASSPLTDNYEGLAVETDARGNLVVWLVADDNQAQFLQKSWLLKLELPADEIAGLGD